MGYFSNINMHVLVTEFNQNPNVGLYGFVNDKFCILGNNVKEDLVKKISNVLNVPCYSSNIFGTELVGVFIAGNNDYMIVPELLPNEEKLIDEIASKHDMKIVHFKSKLNAFGNNIVIKDKNVIINPDYPKKDVELLTKMLKEIDEKIVVSKFHISEVLTLGSVITVSSRGALLGYKFEKELDELEKIFDKMTLGSVLDGSPFVSSGILVNKFGFIAGNTCTGIELGIIDEAFGFLEDLKSD